MSVKRFLLVEDDLDDQLLFSEIFRDVAPGHICDIVNNGQEALDYLTRTTPDLIITDINLPKIDGFELIRIIKKELMIPVPVVAWSTKSPHAYWVDELDIVAAFEKPFDIQHLYEFVREIISMVTV